MSNAESRTEKPTPKRKRDARERGQVARSRDLAGAVSLAAAVMTLAWLGSRMASAMSARVIDGFQQIGDSARDTITPASLGSTIWSDVGLLAQLAGPTAVVGACLSVGASFFQTGWAYSPKALRLKWDRLSPSNGIKRFSPGQAGAELGKALIGLAVLTFVCYAFVRDLLYQAPTLTAMSPLEIGRYGWDSIWSLLWRASLALVAVAAADYALQHYRWLSQLKMTRQEVKDEFKANEGNPEIKARVRRIQRDMTRRRMLTAVKSATVVITNPTHFAVALTYRRADMAAPVVVAKGQDLMAARIRAVANKHGVPIVENVSLARALYKTADVGESIPGPLFGAVAEVLAYLVRLKQLVL